MAEATLHIGGHGVHLCGGDTVERALHIPGMKVFEVRNSEFEIPSMEVRLDRVVTLPDCRWLHEFRILDGQQTCRFGVDAERTYYYTFDRHGVLRYREGEGVDIDMQDNMEALRFALWTAYAMMGVRLGAAPVHSSVVVCEGKAVMCLGESGTGKSTHTRLWLENIAGTHLLNDDSPIVSLVGDEVRVFGSPWSGKSDCYLQESYPIAGLLRLEQRKENTIRRLGVVESFTALQPSCPPSLAKDELCMDLLVEYISKVIERVPVYRMGCLPDADAARLSHKTIIG
ncbi:MAG: hypothetical protein J6X59_05990 [Bacteroidales bacterium]|nr:hypothetical protein [Bacteroidales bacterium]